MKDLGKVRKKIKRRIRKNKLTQNSCRFSLTIMVKTAAKKLKNITKNRSTTSIYLQLEDNNIPERISTSGVWKGWCVRSTTQLYACHEEHKYMFSVLSFLSQLIENILIRPGLLLLSECQTCLFQKANRSMVFFYNRGILSWSSFLCQLHAPKS